MDISRIEELVTIITPTYNRVNTLINLYSSLKKQTNKKFIWIIVDDGSGDSTSQVVESFIKENDFKIQYIKQENGGKHRALNNGIKLIETELTFIVDSDDILTNEAIELIYSEWNSKKEKNLCGISFLRGFSDSNVIGKKFPRDNYIDTFINVRINENVTGDKAEVWVTKLLRETPFLEFSNEKFFGEGYVWIELSKKYSMIFVNKIIYISEYLDGGLTKSGRKLRINCPRGGMANAKKLMSEEFNTKVRIKNTWLYICYGLFAGESLMDIVSSSGYRSSTFLNLPFGFLLYKFWDVKYQ